MGEKKGIDEIKEVITALEVSAETAGKVMADGKASVSDLQYAKDVIENFKVYTQALEGIKNVPAEATDLDNTELIEIGASFVKVLQAYQKGKAEA